MQIFRTTQLVCFRAEYVFFLGSGGRRPRGAGEKKRALLTPPSSQGQTRTETERKSPVLVWLDVGNLLTKKKIRTARETQKKHPKNTKNAPKKHKNTPKRRKNTFKNRAYARKKNALFQQTFFLLVGPDDQQRRELPLWTEAPWAMRNTRF